MIRSYNQTRLPIGTIYIPVTSAIDHSAVHNCWCLLQLLYTSMALAHCCRSIYLLPLLIAVRITAASYGCCHCSSLSSLLLFLMAPAAPHHNYYCYDSCLLLLPTMPLLPLSLVIPVAMCGCFCAYFDILSIISSVLNSKRIRAVKDLGITVLCLPSVSILMSTHRLMNRVA